MHIHAENSEHKRHLVLFPILPKTKEKLVVRVVKVTVSTIILIHIELN